MPEEQLGIDFRTKKKGIESFDADLAAEESIVFKDQEIGVKPQDALDKFRNATIRQLMLVYPLEQYWEVVAALTKIVKEKKLKNNSEAVIYLLKRK